jgi:cold shock CspA family protein
MPEHGFGFIETPDGREIYFHVNAVVQRGRPIARGDHVRFVEEPGDHGPQATTVHLMTGHGGG